MKNSNARGAALREVAVVILNAKCIIFNTESIILNLKSIGLSTYRGVFVAKALHAMQNVPGPDIPRV